jgi:transcriptional regulator CtsR
MRRKAVSRKVVIPMSMMLSDKIEQLILDLMDKQGLGGLTLSRKELADFLGCAPSQVTYVINTRFSGNRNYVVESRRGNGGYIRITYSPRVIERKKEKLQKASAGESPGKNSSQASSVPGNEFFNDFKKYLELLRSYQLIDDREHALLSCMAGHLFSFCPDSQKKEAAVKAVHDINSILEGGEEV